MIDCRMLCYLSVVMYTVQVLTVDVASCCCCCCCVLRWLWALSVCLVYLSVGLYVCGQVVWVAVYVAGLLQVGGLAVLVV